MKNPGKFLFVAVLGLFFLSCGSDDGTTEETSTLVLYQIDYNTLAFEGGITLAPRRVPPPLFTEIPLEIEKELPDNIGDGSILISYSPTFDPVFRGVLSESGQANISVPIFLGPDRFSTLEQPLALPANTSIQSVDGDHSQVNFSEIWAAVSNLALTDVVLDENTLFALYLYQPSPEAQHSDNWDWILMLFQQ